MLACRMGLGTTTRRWIGAIAVVTALLMLILGETVLEDRLSKVVFLIYWLTCFVLVGVAIIIAFMDVRTLAERTRHEQRELMDSTLKDIQTDARAKRRK